MFVVSWRELVQRAGPFRKQFALESLTDLHEALEARNQKLVITFLTLQEFISLEVKNNIQQIVIEEDVTYDEQVQLQNIQKIAFETNIKLYSKIDSTLTDFQKSIALFAGQNMIFTEFRKKIEKNLSKNTTPKLFSPT